MQRWIVPYWGQHRLFEVRTIEVECWLRRLPLAKSTCAKIRNVMSVLFNHACRYELYDHNPIHLVRQSAKRKQTPSLLTPAEIKALVDTLGLRERTLVLLAASTGLRQSELFALKWGDIDFAGGTMSVTRSIVYGVVGRCKTEPSQKPVPLHPRVAETLMQWKERCAYREADDWVFASKQNRGRRPYWGQAILRRYLRPAARALGIEKRIGWHTFLFELVTKRGHGPEGDARAVAALFVPIHIGCLHPGDHASQACGASSGTFTGVLLGAERRIDFRCCGEQGIAKIRAGNWLQYAMRTQKGADLCLFAPSLVL